MGKLSGSIAASSKPVSERDIGSRTSGISSSRSPPRRHFLRTPSVLQVTMPPILGRNRTCVTGLLTLNRRMHRPVTTSHIAAAPSRPPVRSVKLSGLGAKLTTASSWPSKDLTNVADFSHPRDAPCSALRTRMASLDQEKPGTFLTRSKHARASSPRPFRHAVLKSWIAASKELCKPTSSPKVLGRHRAGSRKSLANQPVSRDQSFTEPRGPPVTSRFPSEETAQHVTSSPGALIVL